MRSTNPKGEVRVVISVACEMGCVLESSRARRVPASRAGSSSLREKGRVASTEGARSRAVANSLNIKVHVLILRLFPNARPLPLILDTRYCKVWPVMLHE